MLRTVLVGWGQSPKFLPTPFFSLPNIIKINMKKKILEKNRFFRTHTALFWVHVNFHLKIGEKHELCSLLITLHLIYDLRPRFSCNEIISEYPKYSILSRVARFCMQGCQFCRFYSIFGDFFLDITH